MPLYEHVFLVRQDVSSAQVEALTDQFKTIIEGGGGKIAKSEYWGVKSLTYRIKKNRKAHFSLLNIDAEHAAVAEMERQMRLSDDVIRYLTLKVDELEDGPSAMTRSRGGRDRDDRRDDRRGGRDRSDDRPPRGEDKPSREEDKPSREKGSNGSGSDSEEGEE